MKKILVTGASGFIGSSIVEQAVGLGYETWAGVRSSSSKAYLQDEAIQFVTFNYDDKNVLKQQLTDFAKRHGRFDYIVHCAGITKALHKSDFDQTNFYQTANLVDALVDTGTVPELFVLMSTLGVMGPGDEVNYTPIRHDQSPQPNTAYGKSKLKTERYIQNTPNFPYLFLRPTGVYGPRDRDYLILIKSIKNRLEVGAGYKKQLLSFIYIDDLVNILFAAIDRGVTHRAYNISDGRGYTDIEFNEMVKELLDVSKTLSMKLPLGLVKVAAKGNELLSQIVGQPTTFNSDKYHIMKQRNWTCDITPLEEELGFEAQYPLREGLEATIEWYKNEGWL